MPEYSAPPAEQMDWKSFTEYACAKLYRSQKDQRRKLAIQKAMDYGRFDLTIEELAALFPSN